MSIPTSAQSASFSPAKTHKGQPKHAGNTGHTGPATQAPSPATGPTSYDLLVLGAGASGLMCAYTAAKRGLRVALLDQAVKPGRKIAISGGGKCNFTNHTVLMQDYVSAQPTFCEPALQNFTPRHMLNWFKAHRLTWEERDHGRLFGLQSAEELVDALVQDCFAAGVEMHTRTKVLQVQRPPSLAASTDTNASAGISVTASPLPKGSSAPLFQVHCARLDAEGQEVRRDIWQASQVVLALGSPAWPQCGASDAGLKCAKALGHSLRPVRPVLTPFTMPQNWPLRDLAGISLDVEISVAGHSFADALLFTHQGISGPAALLASCHWSQGTPLSVNFLPGQSFTALLDAKECGKLLVKNLLGRHLPQRLVEGLLPEDLARRKVAELSRGHRNLLAQSVHSHTVIPSGVGDLRKAEAAAGGVNVREVNPHSMGSLLVAGLYFSGEVLDVAGHLGGFNLHWAWASGILAGESVILSAPAPSSEYINLLPV